MYKLVLCNTKYYKNKKYSGGILKNSTGVRDLMMKKNREDIKKSGDTMHRVPTSPQLIFLAILEINYLRFLNSFSGNGTWLAFTSMKPVILFSFPNWLYIQNGSSRNFSKSIPIAS